MEVRKSFTPFTNICYNKPIRQYGYPMDSIYKGR